MQDIDFTFGPGRSNDGRRCGTFRLSDEEMEFIEQFRDERNMSLDEALNHMIAVGFRVSKMAK